VIEARIHLPTPPSTARWQQLTALAEVLTEGNAYWYGAQLDRAEALEAQGTPSSPPPCCLSCARPRIRYVVPPGGDMQFCQNWWSAPQVLARGKANCLDASAYDAGAARAKGKVARVVLEPQGEPRIPGDPYSTLDFHAVAIIDGERVDSSARLQGGKDCSCG
jgi:hypothetical protein